MPERLSQPGLGGGGRLAAATAWLAVAAAGTLTAGLVWAAYAYYPEQLGVAQPLPFSHRLHAREKGISCFLCHPEAATDRRAGIPPLDTCLLCHRRIIITHPEIQKLRAQYDERRPIEWVQIYDVPEFVYFDHATHVRRQVDCGVCHGDVSGMDRVVAAHNFTMGFCVQCHRDHGASHDCYRCHR